jgi:hypothetical protein
MDAGKQLNIDGFIFDEQLKNIQQFESNKNLSVHWELRTILYLGILLFISGIGIFVYLNIDTIGHQAILASIAIICCGCLYYSHKNKLPFSNEQTKHSSPFFDYIILLGCLLFGIFIGYIQYQYSIFGFHYGLATLTPTLLFFYCAYIFDHKGILSLGITGLAGWAGLSVTPMQLLEKNDFSSTSIIFTALTLGAIITLFARYCDTKNIKKHFSFSYNNFSANILFIAALGALFTQPLKLISFILLSGICFYYIKYAIAQKSFLFLLLSIIYGYIGLTYLVFSLLTEIRALEEILFLFGSLYTAASCAGIVLFFIFYKKILGIKK